MKDVSLMKYAIGKFASVVILTVCVSRVYAVDFTPHYTYIFSVAGAYDAGPVVDHYRYDTVDEAYQAYRNYVEPLNPSTVNLDLFDPNPGDAINGMPITYSWHVRNAGQPFAGASMGDFKLLAECPADSDRTFSSNSNGHGYTMVCLPKAVHELDCNSCQTRGSIAQPPVVGDPIFLATAVQQQVEVDYTSAGSTLQLVRTYRSDRKTWINNYQIFGIDFSTIASNLNVNGTSLPGNACHKGVGESSGLPYCFPYADSSGTSGFSIQRGSGRLISFGTMADHTPAADINDRIQEILDTSGNIIGWTATNAAAQTIETYNTVGRLLSIKKSTGLTTTFKYSDSSSLTDAPVAGLLLEVSDNYGRTLRFKYDGASRIIGMTDPSGGSYFYNYDEASSIVASGARPSNNLTSVIYPDGSKRIYYYNEPDKTSGANLPFSLTGIVDENGTRYASFSYDAYGNAIGTAHAEGVEKYSVSYPSLFSSSTSTDPLGAIRTYNFQTILGLVKFLGESYVDNGTGITQSSKITYDVNGNVATTTDYNNIKNIYTFDLSRNLETARVEAIGTSAARTISTSWHPTFRIPVQIAEPLRLTSLDYDVSGNLIRKTIQATTDTNGLLGFSAPVIGTSRNWTYTYNGVGKLLTSIGPRTDISDVTNYAYDAMGNLITVTNAAGQITTLSNYDANGRVGRIATPNGVTTDVAYMARGWLSSRVVTSGSVVETTNYAYDGVGQLIKVTLPDASSINYTYDDAHRLMTISDSVGNSIHYTFDLAGNRIGEQVADSGGTLAQQVSRVYDQLNRLQQQTGTGQ